MLKGSANVSADAGIANQIKAGKTQHIACSLLVLSALFFMMINLITSLG